MTTENELDVANARVATLEARVKELEIEVCHLHVTNDKLSNQVDALLLDLAFKDRAKTGVQ